MHHRSGIMFEDTYYVGTIKGIGGICQQTSIDAHAKIVHVKLYDGKNTLVAAYLRNDRVIPFYNK